jgi:hypothetical protein
MLKICACISDADTQNSHSFIHFSYLLPDVSVGRTAGELWWTSQELSTPASSSPRLSMLIHHLGDEQ